MFIDILHYLFWFILVNFTTMIYTADILRHLFCFI